MDNELLTKSKYPFILVHGIALKDFLWFKAFGKIEKKLTDAGFNVYSAKIDSFGCIETNAIQLKNEIITLMQKHNVDKVNIIAHSKGGLDSKYMINNLNMENNVATLTTLCTPHKGSPIATLIMKLPNFITKFIAFFINLFYRILGDKKPNSFKVCQQLKANKHIDEESLKCHDNVYCQSYSVILEKGKHDISMAIQAKICKKLSGDESDGLVTLESTKFGNYMGHAIDDSVSHSQIVDQFSRKKTKQKVYQFYIDLCNSLIKKGY